MNPKAKKIIKTSVNVLLWVFLGLMTLLVVLVFAARVKNAELPQLGGKYYMTVGAESMTGTFNKGDIIIVEDFTSKSRDQFEDGEVITFYCYVDGEKIINSHRIVSSELKGNERIYQTKGDANTVQDSYTVSEDNVIGRWTGKKISGLGGFISFLQSTLGFILCILLPMVAILIYQLVVFIKTVIAYKNRNKVVMTKEEEELIKAKAIEEYLAKQKALEENNTQE